MERVEDLQLGGLRILRRDDLPGYTTDAVLLADFAKGLKGSRVCDLGAGTGIISLLLIGRRPELCVTGLEISPDLAALAQRSAALNDLAGQMHILQGDIREIHQLLPATSFDAVICNPPYHADGQGGQHSHQHCCDEEDVAGAAGFLLKPKGRLYVCCPPKRMFVMAEAMKRRSIEPKRLRLVASLPHKAPYLCLIEGISGAKPGCVLEPQLVLMQDSGTYSAEYKAIYHMEEEDDS